jgi:hypothetical protein
MEFIKLIDIAKETLNPRELSRSTYAGSVAAAQSFIFSMIFEIQTFSAVSDGSLTHLHLERSRIAVPNPCPCN